MQIKAVLLLNRYLEIVVSKSVESVEVTLADFGPEVPPSSFRSPVKFAEKTYYPVSISPIDRNSA